MNKRQLRRSLRKAINEMAKGAPDGYGGYEYREDKSQFNDAHSALKTPLGHASNSSDVGSDLWDSLMDIFREAHAKGIPKERMLGIAEDAIRDFDV